MGGLVGESLGDVQADVYDLSGQDLGRVQQEGDHGELDKENKLACASPKPI